MRPGPSGLWLVFLILFLAIPTPSWADLSSIPLQGYVVDNQSGKAVEGSYEVTLRLYDDCDEGDELASDTQDLEFSNGVFNTTMAVATATVKATDTLCLGIQFSGDTEMTRVEVQATPYAVRASLADLATTATTASTALALDSTLQSNLLTTFAGSGLSTSNGALVLDTSVSKTWTGAQSYSAQVVASKSPADTSSSNASMRINPTSSISNGKLFAIQDNGTDRFIVDKEGDVTIAGDLTITGSLNMSFAGDITSVTAGTGLSGGGTSGDVTLTLNQAVAPTWTGAHTFSSTAAFGGATSFTTDADFTFSGTENLAITSDLDGSVGLVTLTATPSSTTGTTVGIGITQANSANTNGLDTAFGITNSDTDLALTNGIQFTSAGGGFTYFLETPSIDISGAGAITGATGITSSGTITLSGLASCTSVVTSAGGVLSCGTGAVEGGDITAVTAGAGLTGTATSGAVTLDIGAGTGITVAADAISITADSVGGTQLSATMTLADADFLDMSAINTSSTTEGLKLPQATDVSASTAEGQLTWDTDDDALYVGTGASASKVSNPFGTAIDSSEITDGAIVNADVNAAAAIAYSKLNLSSSIVTGDITDGTIANADVSATAAIAYSKLNLSSSIVTGDVTDNTLTASDLSATLTFADADLVDMSAINGSGTGEGLKLPQATNVSLSTAEGQLTWDTDDDALYVGTGASITKVSNPFGTAIDSSEITDDTIVNADINSAAAIAYSKLNLSGAITSSDITNATIATADIAGSAVTTSEIAADTITASDLNATLTFADSDLVDLSAVNVSTATEGLKLPQATDVSAGTAEGQLSWDTDDDALYVGTGAGATKVSNPFGSAIDSSDITDGAIVNADVNAAAAIAYSKLSLGSSIVTGDITDGTIANADVSATAAIAYSKLSLGSSIVTGDITDNTITASDLSATITLVDSDFINMSAINSSGTSEGLILPQATDVSAGTAEGQISWDTDNDTLYVGTGAAAQAVSNPFGAAIDSSEITDGTIANADVSGTAAIAYSKLSLGSSIVTGDITDGTIANADVSATAAIAYSKLSLGSSIVSGDITDSTITGSDLAATVAGAGLTGGAGSALAVGAGSGITVNADDVQLSYAATLAGDPTMGAGESRHASTGMIFEGSTADTSEGLLTVADPGADLTWTLPAVTGTIVTTGDTGSVTSTMISDGTIANADVSGTAAIAYSKLNLTGTIVNADVSGSAAIAYSKLSLGSSIVTGDISNGTIATADIAGSAVTTTEIAADTVTASDLNATLTFADSDLVDMSSINASSTTEGLKLPQATDVSAATAEGLISWDTDDNVLYVGNGASASAIVTTFGASIDSSEITDGTIANADVSGTAAIAYSKLSLSSSIVTGDITDATIVAGDAAADTFDFASLEDTLDVDANVTLNQGSYTWAQNFTGTTTDAFTLTASSLTTGSDLVLVGPSGGTAGMTDALFKLTSDIGAIGTSNGMISSTATIDSSTGSSAVNLYLSTTNSNSGSANTSYGIYNTQSDAVALANTNYGAYLSVANTGATSSGTKTVYGDSITASATSATGGTTAVYGSYITTTATHAADSGTVNQYGIYVANGTSSTNGTATKYGLYVESATGADSNYGAVFAGGNVGIGDTTPDFALDVEKASTTVAQFNRTTDDGTVVSIAQDGTEEGTISVSGTTVSYNAFTGSHYAHTKEELEKGMLVSLTGNNSYLNDNPESEIIYGVSKTAKANDAAVLGAYLSYLNPGQPRDEKNPRLIMAVGNGVMWVMDTGQDLAPGEDLVSSSVAGHAMADTGEWAESHVIAKLAQPVNWEEVTDTVMVDGVARKHKRVSVLFGAFTKSNGFKDSSEISKLKEQLKKLQEELSRLKTMELK